MTVEPIVVMTTTEAEWVTNRIRNAVSSIRVGFDELESAVIAAKNGSAHVALGYPSWTAYLSDTLGREPLRLDATERRELVAYLSGQGMSTRAIAPIVGVTDRTVSADIKSQVRSDFAPAPANVDTETGEITETTGAGEPSGSDTAPAAATPAPVTGLDGKTYTRPVAPRVPEKRTNVPAAISSALVQIDTGRRALEAITAAQLRSQDEEARSRWAANLSEQIEALSGFINSLGRKS